MSFIYDLHKRIYKNVAASSTVTLDYVVPDGEILSIDVIGLNSSAAPDTSTCLVWDALGTPEIVLSSYGDVLQPNLNLEFLGDGVKVLRIVLANDLTEPTYMGGYWQGGLL